MAFEWVLFCLYNCCFPTNSSCTPYFVLFIMMPCSIQNFINYNRALPPAQGRVKGDGVPPARPYCHCTSLYGGDHLS